MIKELYTIADRIKMLREKHGKTQSEVAKSFGISRSAVNSWEMGLTVPSTQYIVELSKMFDVSSDFLLGLEYNAVVSVEGLSQKQIAAVIEVITCFRGAPVTVE